MGTPCSMANRTKPRAEEGMWQGTSSRFLFNQQPSHFGWFHSSTLHWFARLTIPYSGRHLCGTSAEASPGCCPCAPSRLLHQGKDRWNPRPSTPFGSKRNPWRTQQRNGSNVQNGYRQQPKISENDEGWTAFLGNWLASVEGHQAPLLFRIDCRKLTLPEVRLLVCHRAL